MKHISNKHISRTKRRMKKYTKTAKRLARIKRRTRRIMKNKRMSNKHNGHRMRGGGESVVTSNGTGNTSTNAVIPAYNAGPGGDTTRQTNANMAQNNQAQNSSNKSLTGGGYKKKYKQHKQRGGNNSILQLYAYEPPPGMMGPVSQPSVDAASNNLILQAAKISVNGQANAEYDNNVGNVVSR